MHFTVGAKKPVLGTGLKNLLAFLLLLVVSSTLAQDERQTDDESNLGPPVELEEAEGREAEGQPGTTSATRRIRRLGDVQAEEWQPQFDTAPGAQRRDLPAALPDPDQTQRLYELLDDLAATPGNT